MKHCFIVLLIFNTLGAAIVSLHAMDQQLLPVPLWTQHAKTIKNYLKTAGIPLNNLNNPEVQKILLHHRAENPREFDLLTKHFEHSQAELAQKLALVDTGALYNTLDFAVFLGLQRNAFIASLASYCALRLSDDAKEKPLETLAFLLTSDKEVTNRPLITSLQQSLDDFWIRLHPPKTLLHQHEVKSARFNHDSTHIVTISKEIAYIWRAIDGELLHTLTGHTEAVTSAEFNHDGTRIVTASNDGMAYIWDATTGAKLHALAGHRDAVKSARFNQDGTRIVTASNDRTARIWDCTTGELLHAFTGHKGMVRLARFNHNGTRIVAASNMIIYIRDTITGEQLHSIPRKFTALDAWVNSAQFNRDSTRIATASNDLYIWDATNGSLIHALIGHTQLIRLARFSPDGKHVVTASGDKTAKVWNVVTGELLHVLVGHGDSVDSVKFNHDGTRIVTGSWDRTARIWDMATGTLLHMFNHAGHVYSVQFDHEGTRIVVASGDHIPTCNEHFAYIWHIKPPACSLAQALLIKLIDHAQQKNESLSLCLPENGLLLEIFNTLDPAWKNALKKCVMLPAIP